MHQTVANVNRTMSTTDVVILVRRTCNVLTCHVRRNWYAVCTKAVVYDFHNVTLRTFIRPKVLYNIDKMNIRLGKYVTLGRLMSTQCCFIVGSPSATMIQCWWATIYSVIPTLKQYRVTASCLHVNVTEALRIIQLLKRKQRGSVQPCCICCYNTLKQLLGMTSILVFSFVVK